MKFTIIKNGQFKKLLALCAMLPLLLVACGKGEGGKSPTQVAARVDSTEISMHQINQVMKTAKNVTAENAPKVRQEILEKLIDQQIILDKAEKDNLDRTPEVMLAVEAAKKEIIARAYLQKLVSSSIKVNDAEIKKYYDEHPGLFAKRRIYNLQDIGIESNPELLATLKDDVAKQKSMQEIADALKGKGIKFSGGSYNRPAEQIPLDILPKLQDTKDGETIIVGMGPATHVIRVVKTQSAPIDLNAATPFIRNYFMNIRGKEFVESEMKKLRKEAKVEYMGDFAAATASAPTTSPSVSADKPSEDGASAKKSAIEAGVAGLK